MHPLEGGNKNIKPNFDKDMSNMVPITGIDSLFLEIEEDRQKIQDLLADPAKYWTSKLS